MKETVNSWIIKEDYYDRNKKNREKKRKNKPEAHFNVYVCPECNRVHEHYYDAGRGMDRAYYKDFPKYKLKRVNCIECDG